MNKKDLNYVFILLAVIAGGLATYQAVTTDTVVRTVIYSIVAGIIWGVIIYSLYQRLFRKTLWP